MVRYSSPLTSEEREAKTGIIGIILPLMEIKQSLGKYKLENG